MLFSLGICYILEFVEYSDHCRPVVMWTFTVLVFLRNLMFPESKWLPILYTYELGTHFFPDERCTAITEGVSDVIVLHDLPPYTFAGRYLFGV